MWDDGYITARESRSNCSRVIQASVWIAVLAVLAVLAMLTALAVLTLCLQDTARVNLGSLYLLCLLQLLY